MHLIFLIYVFSTVVYSGCCFNPYLRDPSNQNADQMLEYADFDNEVGYDKREIAGNEDKQQDVKVGGEWNPNKEPMMKKRSVVDNMSRLGELNKMNDDDIAAALSRLSVGELDTLDRFIDEKVQVECTSL